MFRSSMIFRVVAALLLVGVLAAAGVMLFQAGQAQGYAMSLAANGEAVRPNMPGWMLTPAHGFGFWRPHFFPFGLFFCLIPLLFFFLFGGLFRAFAWRGHPRAWGHGPWGYGPEGHTHWHTHPHGPQPESSQPGTDQPKTDQPGENR